MKNNKFTADANFELGFKIKIGLHFNKSSTGYFYAHAFANLVQSTLFINKIEWHNRLYWTCILQFVFNFNEKSLRNPCNGCFLFAIAFNLPWRGRMKQWLVIALIMILYLTIKQKSVTFPKARWISDYIRKIFLFSVKIFSIILSVLKPM